MNIAVSNKLLCSFHEISNFYLNFNYRHHPTDVITGIIVGIIFAAIILMFLVDLFNRPRSFEVKYEQIEGDEENPMGMGKSNF